MLGGISTKGYSDENASGISIFNLFFSLLRKFIKICWGTLISKIGHKDSNFPELSSLLMLHSCFKMNERKIFEVESVISIL